jgi:hypothetical protein
MARNRKVSQETQEQARETQETQEQARETQETQEQARGKVFDFGGTVDTLHAQLQQMENISPQKKLHILRMFAKHKRYQLNRYRVFHRALGITVDYIFSGGFNFVIRTPRGDAGVVIINTNDADNTTANAVYEATLWVVRYIESSAAYSIYDEARRSGFVIGPSRKV